MQIFKYFCKEIFTALIGLTCIILLIFLSNQFVQYLSRAASGQLPGLVVLQLMALEVPNLLSLLLPLGFYVAVLIVYGRLYADSEMIALTAAGFSQKQLTKYTLLIASGVALLVGYLVFWVNPGIYYSRAKLIRNQGIATMIKTIIPQRFREIDGGNKVFYVDEMTSSNQKAKGIFLAEKAANNQWKIIWADGGALRSNDKSKQYHMLLNDGRVYQGNPGQADYQIFQFDNLDAPLPTPVISVADDVRTLSTKQLLPFNNPDKNLVAELNWRLSIPMMVFVLSLLALPLSQVHSRQGKYAKLLPALLLYVLYANFMFVGRDWLVNGVVPWWLGFWWLHGLMIALSFALIVINKRKT